MTSRKPTLSKKSKVSVKTEYGHHLGIAKGQLILKCLIHTSKVEFFRSFFGRIEETKKTFRN